MKDDALLLHLRDAASSRCFSILKSGMRSATGRRFGVLLEHMHAMTRTAQLLRRGETRGAGADHRY